MATVKDFYTWQIPPADAAITSPAQERRTLRDWLGVTADARYSADGGIEVTIFGEVDPQLGYHPGVQQMRDVLG